MRSESRGAGLLELLLALAVFMSVLPFVYDFALDQKDRAENARMVRELKAAADALEKYVEEHRQELLAPVSANVTRVRLADLNLEPGALGDSKVRLRIVKSRDSAGRAFVQGIVIFDSKNLTPFRTRQIAAMGGAEAGFADGKMLYGSFGAWQAPIARIEAAAGANSILAQTRPFRSGGDYLQRLPSDSPLDAAMQSDLDFGGHNIKDVKNLTATSARFFDLLEADSIETSTMSVANRLDWTAPLDVFGDAQVMGPITSDNRSIDAAGVSIAGKSQFRSLAADSLTADNLYLSGFSVAGDGSPPILSISGSLDMTRGHITALDAYVGFSGSVAPKLIIGSRMEDGANPAFYWNFASGEAELGDLYLTNLSQMMKAAYSREKTGKTETEKLMGGAVQNSNATLSDYMRALDQVKKAVSAKYQEIRNLL